MSGRQVAALELELTGQVRTSQVSSHGFTPLVSVAITIRLFTPTHLVRLVQKAAAPAVPDMPPAPPFEHVEYHHHRGNIGVEGLGWQVPRQLSLIVDPLVIARAATPLSRWQVFQQDVPGRRCRQIGSICPLLNEPPSCRSGRLTTRR